MQNGIISALQKAIITLPVVIVLGVGGGVAVATSISNDQLPAPSSSNSMTRPFDFPVNKNGQTYGSLADSTSVDNVPDLVLVETPDGTTGYISGPALIEAEGGNVSSPKEALAWQWSKDLQGSPELAVYEVDGKTQVGVMTLTPTQ